MSNEAADMLFAAGRAICDERSAEHRSSSSNCPCSYCLHMAHLALEVYSALKPEPVPRPNFTPTRALEVIAAGSCETYTSGAGSCWRNGRGFPDVRQEGATSACYPCVAWAALHDGAELFWPLHEAELEAKRIEQERTTLSERLDELIVQPKQFAR